MRTRLFLILGAGVLLMVGLSFLPWPTGSGPAGAATIPISPALKEGNERLGSSDTPASAGAQTNSGLVSPPEALATPPPYPSHVIDNNPLRDPAVRSNLLRSTMDHQKRLYDGFHRAWLESLGLTPEASGQLVELLLEYDLKIQDYIIPYHSGRPAGVMPEQEVVGGFRDELMARISKEFGPQVAESYRLRFPGPSKSGE